MFSSGDGEYFYLLVYFFQMWISSIDPFTTSFSEVVIAACKEFIESNDSEVMETMIRREWEIYCKNQEKLFETSAAESISEAGSASVGAAEYQEAPELLLTAVAALVDMGRPPLRGKRGS